MPQSFAGAIGTTREASQPDWPAAPPAMGTRPNIVIVYLDDMGYSDLGCYGSEIRTPNIDALAQSGVRFSNYTTHPICSAARAALLTGHNAHAVSSGWLANVAGGFPGYRGEIPADVQTLPEALSAAGYATAMFGKWHNTPAAQCLPTSSRQSWPTQRGFEHFYGIMDGQCNYFFPARLMLGNAVLPMDAYPPDFYTTDAWTDHAIDYMLAQRSGGNARPVFLYLAHNAVHAPLQARAEDIEAYRGCYDAGWTVLREQRFRRQQALGLIPNGTRLATSDPVIPDWSAAGSDDRRWYARHMEVYAAMLTCVDRNLGRLLRVIEALGELDNTLFIVSSDNGGSSMGGPHGAYANDRQFSGLAQPALEVQRSNTDLLGTARSAALYPTGWGQLSNTPFPYYKTYTGGGGRRVPLVASWTGRFDAPGEIRRQFVHVTDVMPTLLDLVGATRHGARDASAASGTPGRSFASVLADSNAPATRNAQYYECWANRAYVQDNWLARSIQRRGEAIDLGNWTLHDLSVDFAEAIDVAADHPQVLAELVDAFDRHAWIDDVYPLDNRVLAERLAERPATAPTPESRTFFAATPTVHRAVVLSLIANRSFSVVVRFRHDSGDQGVLVAVGDMAAGFTMFVEAGQLRLFYNGYGDHSTLALTLPHGDCVAEFRYALMHDRDGIGTLMLDSGASSSAPMSPSLSFGFQEGLDVGIDRRGPVCWELFARHGSFRYGGTIESVEVKPFVAVDNSHESSA